MRKLLYTLTTVMLVAVFSNTSIGATISKTPIKKELSAEQEAALQNIKQRVEEIKRMDKSDLSRSERKELRKELREMKSQAQVIGGRGIYLSVGAIIIIILLLILIL